MWHTTQRKSKYTGLVSFLFILFICFFLCLCLCPCSIVSSTLCQKLVFDLWMHRFLVIYTCFVQGYTSQKLWMTLWALNFLLPLVMDSTGKYKLVKIS